MFVTGGLRMCSLQFKVEPNANRGKLVSIHLDSLFQISLQNIREPVNSFPSNILLVHDNEHQQNPDERKDRMAVCVKPIHYNYDQVSTYYFVGMVSFFQDGFCDEDTFYSILLKSLTQTHYSSHVIVSRACTDDFSKGSPQTLSKRP